MANENQEGKTKRAPRPQIQVYSTAEQAEAFKNHPLLANCMVSQDRSTVIISALDFMHKWKDRVADLEINTAPDQSERVAELEAEIANLQQQMAEKDGQITSLTEDKTSLSNMNEDLREEIDRVVEENNSRSNQAETIAQLQQRISELEAAAEQGGENVTWEQIAQTTDPVYAEMAEVAAGMLTTADDTVTPLRAMVDIFAKYHIFRYAELPFQRFIPEKRLDEIINRHYPEIGGLRGLRNKLE